MTSLDDLRRIAEVEFASIVMVTEMMGAKLRIVLNDGSYLDVWVSRKLPDRFGFHWERRHLDGSIYRYDNFPNTRWQGVTTFPFHFHEGDRDNVVAAPFAQEATTAFRQFMTFVQKKLATP